MARKIPSTRSTSKGPGYGGPARHDQTRGERKAPFALGNTVRQDTQERRVLNREERVQRSAKLEAVLETIADNADADARTRIHAAVALHAIDNGHPIARNVNYNTDDISQLSNAELDAELARLGGAPVAAVAGNETPGMPGKPGDVRH